MVRKMLALMFAVSVVYQSGFTFGQEERPVEHAHPHEHAADHGMHAEHEAAMEEELAPHSQSFLVWFVGALGWKYVLALPASALLSFVLTAALVIGGKGKTTGPALVFVVAIPFLIGLFGMFDGMIASFTVIAYSGSYPKASVIAEGFSMSIVTPLVDMLLMVPSYLLATVGLSVRAFQSDPKA